MDNLIKKSLRMKGNFCDYTLDDLNHALNFLRRVANDLKLIEEYGVPFNVIAALMNMMSADTLILWDEESIGVNNENNKADCN